MSDSLKDLLADIQARQQANKAPKGVVVSSDLFREMQAAGHIQKKTCTPGGLPLDPDWQIDLPFYGDVYVHVDPYLDGEAKPYRLPPQP